MTGDLLRMEIRDESGVIDARRVAREVAAELGLEPQDQVRVATALSEAGRDLFGRAGRVGVLFRVEGGARAALVIEVTSPAYVGDDQARGSARQRASAPLPAEGVAAAGRLMDCFTVETGDGRSTLRMLKRLPGQGGVPSDVAQAAIRERLARLAPSTVMDELRRQNRELLEALDDVQRQREELLRLNAELEETNHGVMALYTQLSQELEETNRGVVALYAELDDKSAELKRLAEAKNRFWAAISHELRTPLNSVIGLVRLLLDPGGEPLDPEQRHQIELIGDSGRTLLDLVNELLDLAKIESGRLVPEPGPVDLTAMLARLRALMRPLTETTDVALVVDGDAGPRTFVTDEVMLTRILRNLLSNGLKFTRRGEVRLSVTADDDHVIFSVRDTGIGIPEDEQSRIFEEFYQVPGGARRDGTGLGLPYARRLAQVLGGDLALRSVPGQGTTVTARLPRRIPDVEGGDEHDGDRRPGRPGRPGDEPAGGVRHDRGER